MFWLIYDLNEWRPDEAEVKALLGKDTTFSLLNGFDGQHDHAVFALLYNVDGLRAFNTGLIEIPGETLPEIPAETRERLRAIYGPFEEADIRESLVRLHSFTLAKSAIEDALSMISLLQSVRQKLSALDQLDKWRKEVEDMGETLGSVTEDLQYNRSQSLEHLVAPLKPHEE